MSEATKQQLMEALQAAGGNAAVAEHIKAALALMQTGTEHKGADNQRGGKSGRDPREPSEREEREFKRPKKAPEHPAGAKKPPARGNSSGDLRRGPPAGEPGRGKEASTSRQDDKGPSGQPQARPRGRPPKVKEVGQKQRDESDSDDPEVDTPIWQRRPQLKKPVAGKSDKGEGLYPSLLHSMGVGQGQEARRAQQDRDPPRRLSSFVNNAVQAGHLHAGFNMEGGGMEDNEHGHNALLAVPRARKGVVRQNSNLTDAVLTNRSLLGTAGMPSAQPSLGGYNPQHRIPQRSATGLHAFQRLQSTAAGADPRGELAASAPGVSPIMGNHEKVLWTGTVKHHFGTMMELCTLMCMLPTECADQFPKTLFISELVQRDSVLLGRHQMVSCAVQDPTPDQRNNLIMMSNMKFTGLVQLQHCELTICPVVDVSGDIKVIGFLISK